MRADAVLRVLGARLGKAMRELGVGNFEVDNWQTAWALVAADCEEDVTTADEIALRAVKLLTHAQALTRIYGNDNV